jgi:hypothetical protein
VLIETKIDPVGALQALFHDPDMGVFITTGNCI